MTALTPTVPAPVSVSHLSKHYGNVTAVDDITFTLNPGKITGFLGPNGAGKTTTLQILLGLSSPTNGSANIFGLPIHQLSEPWRYVGAVLESNDFHPNRAAQDHLRILALLCGLEQSAVARALNLVGLHAAADRNVAGYSLGMRQRLGLAGALLSEPKLLVLDEPTNGLDPAGVRWLRDLLRSYADDGGTVLIASHLLAEIQQCVDHVLVVHEGELKADSPLTEFVDGHATLEDSYLAAIDGARDADLLR